jgi:hypothetical protein
MMNDFQKYKTAYEQMSGDIEIIEVREKIEALRTQYMAALRDLEHDLEELEQPYKNRMMAAEVAIRAAVLETKKTVEMYGVVARYTKGRRSTAWKSVAIAAGATKEDIVLHTKEGDPSVSIFVVNVSK